jgi:uncharacterized protein (DUF433 family)
MASTEHIDTRDGHAYIIGTAFRVAAIYNMVINNKRSVEWIVEQFEILDPAKVHAALVFYYDNPDRIEREWQEWNEDADRHARESGQPTLDEFKAQIAARDKTP